MYCPSCGTKLMHVLSYCNHCGADLAMFQRSDESKSTQTGTVTWVIVGSTIILLGMSLGALVLIKDGAIDPSLGKVFVLFSFVALLIVEGALVFRLLQLNKSKREPRGLAQAKDYEQAAVNPAETRALKDPGEPLPGVTEQTTQAFEPSYRKDHPK